MRWDSIKISAAVMVSLAAAVSSQTRQPCTILRVIDGERLELRSGATMRLAGVQTLPNFSSNRFQIFAFLDSLLIGQSIELEFDEGLPESCGYLWRDTLVINVELLRRGWLQVWDDTTRFKYRDFFLAAENAARQNKSGGWKFAAFVDSAKVAGDDTVYVTKSGKKYHRIDCRLLSPNKTALLLSRARADYSPCRLCASSASLSKAAPSLQPNGKTAAVQCLGKTQKGGRCKREAEAGSKYCWQHRRK
jgi:endonuclease YncB( thermonuclease family)